MDSKTKNKLVIIIEINIIAFLIGALLGLLI